MGCVDGRRSSASSLIEWKRVSAETKARVRRVKIKAWASLCHAMRPANFQPIVGREAESLPIEATIFPIN